MADNKRAYALEWWNALKTEEKILLARRYIKKGAFTLTGREIETIYKTLNPKSTNNG